MLTSFYILRKPTVFLQTKHVRTGPLFMLLQISFMSVLRKKAGSLYVCAPAFNRCAVLFAWHIWRKSGLRQMSSWKERTSPTPCKRSGEPQLSLGWTVRATAPKERAHGHWWWVGHRCWDPIDRTAGQSYWNHFLSEDLNILAPSVEWGWVHLTGRSLPGWEIRYVKWCWWNIPWVHGDYDR